MIKDLDHINDYRLKYEYSNVGLTLVELLVALAVSGLVALALFATFRVQGRSYNQQEHTATLQQILRTSMLLIERNTRMAGLNPEGEAGAKLISANTAHIHFTSDLDKNGEINPPREEVQFGLVSRDGGVDLYIAYHGSGRQTLAENFGYEENGELQGLLFTYFDLDGVEIPAPVPEYRLSDIRTIIVTLTGEDSHPSLPNPIRRSLSSVINCRNLGTWR